MDAEQEIQAAADSWRAALDEAAKRREHLIEKVREGHRSGMSISRLTLLAGVQRMTLRSWLN